MIFPEIMHVKTAAINYNCFLLYNWRLTQRKLWLNWKSNHKLLAWFNLMIFVEFTTKILSSMNTFREKCQIYISVYVHKSLIYILMKTYNKTIIIFTDNIRDHILCIWWPLHHKGSTTSRHLRQCYGRF